MRGTKKAGHLRLSGTVLPALILAGALGPAQIASSQPGTARQEAAPGPAAGRRTLQRFDFSPFPYHGTIPETGRDFLDVRQGDRLGHTSPRGGVLWEDATYEDKRVLLFIPKGFDPNRPATLVLFLHGNLATLERDVVARQQVPNQFAASKLNAVLVAPQFAVNALDSSAGRFWESGALKIFLDEAAKRLARLQGGEATEQTFQDMPVVIVAYSGGYLPAAFSLHWGGAGERVRGVVLLDALFGEADKFRAWIEEHRGDAFFVSAFSQASRGENVALRNHLRQDGIDSASRLPDRITKGSVIFVDSGSADHNGFVTQAWTASPLKAVLSRLADDEAAAPEPAASAAPVLPPSRPGERRLQPTSSGDATTAPDPAGEDPIPTSSAYGGLKHPSFQK